MGTIKKKIKKLKYFTNKTQEISTELVVKKTRRSVKELKKPWEYIELGLITNQCRYQDQNNGLINRT